MTSAGDGCEPRQRVVSRRSRRRATLAAAALVALAPLASGCSVDQGATAATSAGSEPGPASASSGQDWARTVREENARPGTPGWYGDPAYRASGALAAYLDRVSIRPGDDVGLHVSGPGVDATVTALRMGDYGGSGARTVWTGHVRADAQPALTELPDPVPEVPGATRTHTDVAAWPTGLVIPTTGWPEGHYLVAVTSEVAHATRFVPLTVRSADAKGRLLVVSSVLTGQAYNDFGGHSLYHGPDAQLASRARAVSFDRPYAADAGSGQFISMDLPVVRAAEAAGLPLAWATDYDLAVDPTLVDGAAGVVLGGHEEYWTPAMRTRLIEAIGAGTNLASFGANTAYWRIRMAGASSGPAALAERRDGRPRVIFSSKDAAEDPLAASDPVGATDKFRAAPAPSRESDLAGVMFDCNPVAGDWAVADATWWGFEGTGVQPGTTLKGVVGNEIDRFYAGSPATGPRQVVAYGKVACRGGVTAYTGLYTSAASGAGVFAAGTLGWPKGKVSADAETARLTTAITQRILREFATARAGERHPAADTTGAYWLPPDRTTSYGG